MAAVSSAPGLPHSRAASFYKDDERSMSTLPDPRSRAMTPANELGPGTPAQHPDLSNEVATLSTKLINAINYQTNLEDNLSSTRHELDASKARIRQLEWENGEHEELVNHGILVKRSVVEGEIAKLSEDLADEREQRGEVERGKKGIEQELENLTTALFEEANKMVISSREQAQKQQDAVIRKNDQLKSQLADTETLLKSHQEQLADLKKVLEQMGQDRDDQTNATEPSTPGISKLDINDLDHDVDPLTTQSGTAPPSPSYPTSFTYLVQPVLRTDLAAYDEFLSLLHMSKNVVPGNRASSGSYSSIGLGLGLGGYTGGSSQLLSSTAATSPTTVGAVTSTPGTPLTPASSINSNANAPNSLTPLKETKFFRRALAEDIEPTLRLDTAPGLSWLARRTVLNAICEGTMVVEPLPASTKLHRFPCSLCGENRKDPTHVRTHRFRTSENDNAQRYPLCNYCLGRVRSTCDFLGFLRVLKEGYWRADDEEAEKSAWEEGVRLREQMFWRRMGGGVVPSASRRESLRSPRFSEDKREQVRKQSEELERTGEIKPRDITPLKPAVIEAARSEAREATVEAVMGSAGGEIATTCKTTNSDIREEMDTRPGVPSQDEVPDAKRLSSGSPGAEGASNSKRLSVTIPSNPSD